VRGLGAHLVYLVADVLNAGSQAVARHAGFTQEGVLRSYLGYRDGSRGDAALFSRLPGD
jgi:RimJ/RimL family protein N-acetyltransferase